MNVRELSKDDEIKMLKKTVRAQERMILAYKIGMSKMPEWVFEAIRRTKNYYNVDTFKDLK